MTNRLQKVLANLGLGSRREIENWIQQGRISVNGKIAELGVKVSDQDKIKLDGKLIDLSVKNENRVLIYNKPAGEVVTRDDPEKRATIFDRLPKLQASRWISVGRLDISTTGLLLLTTDGELANRLMHPSQRIKREYAVRILGEVDGLILDKLHKGVKLDDGMASFESIKDGGGRGANHWYHVVIREGRNREVRRLWESQGLTVSRLIRTKFAEIPLPSDLRSGEWRDLDKTSTKRLYDCVKLSV